MFKNINKNILSLFFIINSILILIFLFFIFYLKVHIIEFSTVSNQSESLIKKKLCDKDLSINKEICAQEDFKIKEISKLLDPNYIYLTTISDEILSSKNVIKLKNSEFTTRDYENNVKYFLHQLKILSVDNDSAKIVLRGLYSKEKIINFQNVLIDVMSFHLNFRLYKMAQNNIDKLIKKNESEIKLYKDSQKNLLLTPDFLLKNITKKKKYLERLLQINETDLFFEILNYNKVFKDDFDLFNYYLGANNFVSRLNPQIEKKDLIKLVNIFESERAHDFIKNEFKNKRLQYEKNLNEAETLYKKNKDLMIYLDKSLFNYQNFFEASYESKKLINFNLMNIFIMLFISFTLSLFTILYIYYLKR